jgi:ATP-dependent helicase/nuclease subunit B
VVAALGRWDVAADDSGGHALAGSTAGTFARLAADAALGGLAPVTLLALLKHPHCRFGDPDGQHSNAVAALERTLLRGPRPRAGTAGLAHALESFRHQRSGLHRSDPRMLVSDADLEQAAVLIGRLAAALLPLESLGRRMHPLAEIAARHRQVLESLNMDGSAFAFHDGTMLAVALDDMTDSTAAARLTLLPGDYPDLFEAVINDRVVRRPDAAGLRVHIFGPLEARLQTPHRVILGGLIEHTWPPDARTDPWLSRPMRHELGLDPPERRIGLSAHDFAQALGAPEVILSRAAKVGGAPTVASRFVQRLAAVAGQERWRQALRRGERYLDLTRSLDRPAQIERIKPPAPRPPRNARPTAMSVTDVEHWLRDPYTIYAKHVLRLTPLDAVDTPPGAVDRGNVIHAAVSDFTLRFSAQLPADPEAELIELGRKHFVALEDYPEARAFWWPRFQRIARWFARWETERRTTLAAVHSEIRGEIAIALGERTFRLSARADRIERRSDGRYAVLDYKTGAARSEKQVRTGLAPQLTLEAAILAGGGFPMLPRGASTAEIVYVTLRGGEPAGECAAIDFREGTPDSHAELALARLCALAARFEDESVPYRSLVHPMWKNHYGNYDHLARVKEWSATGADEAGGQE